MAARREEITPTGADAELQEALHEKLANSRNMVVESGLTYFTEVGFQIPTAHQVAKSLIDWDDQDETIAMTHELRNDRSQYNRLQRALIQANDRRAFR